MKTILDSSTLQTLRRSKAVLVAMAAASCTSACRDGNVDETCYWGPIPNQTRMQELKNRGIKTLVMVRLNPMQKVEANARSLGINYVHIPTGLFVSPPEDGINKFVEVASNPANHPLYICDQLARDRTQFYAGLYGMVHKGWTADRASWQMYRNGLRHWWPWFYKYHSVAKQHEEEILKANAVLIEREKLNEKKTNTTESDSPP